MKFLAALVLLFLALPAQAEDYYIFVPGSATARKWVGHEPVPGVHCPLGSEVVVLEVVNGDTDVHNYKCVEGKLVWIDRKAEAEAALLANPPAPRPNSEQFKNALFTNPNLPPAVVVSLMMFFPLVDKYAYETAKLQAAWAQINAAAPAWLTPEVKAIVEEAAVAANMPLTP